MKHDSHMISDGAACVVPTLTLDEDDLESITRTMQKVERYLHEVGFTYVSLGRSESSDNSRWTWDRPTPVLTRQ